MLRPIREKWTIVIRGKWNESIFTPKWLSENVFDNKNITLEFPMEPGLPRRITSDGITVIPDSNRLLLNPTELYDDYLERMEHVACQLLDKLPHTPISHTGINFGYRVEPVSDDLQSHFLSPDESRFGDVGMRIRLREYGRRFDMDGQILNLKCELSENSESLDFGFNFHSESSTADSARKVIEGHVLELRDKADLILRQIYDLSKEDE